MKKIQHLYKVDNGITMIALVITIIVMLILAGVSLNLSVGEDGVLSQTQNTIDKNEVKSVKEEFQLLISKYIKEYYSQAYKDGSDSYANEREYIVEKINNKALKDEYYMTADNFGNVKIYKGKSAIETNKIVTGTISEDGEISF